MATQNWPQGITLSAILHREANATPLRHSKISTVRTGGEVSDLGLWSKCSVSIAHHDLRGRWTGCAPWISVVVANDHVLYAVKVEIKIAR